MTVGASEAARNPLAARRALVSWCLFDWANSAFATVIQTFVFAAYFSHYVARDDEEGPALWGEATTVAAVAIAIVSPIVGAIADQGGRRKPWLLAFSLISVVSTAALWFVHPDKADILLALVAFAVATVGFEVGTTFYNAMLPDLVPARYIGRLSGWSWGLGYMGGLSCLAVSLFVFVRPDPALFGLDRGEGQLEHVRVVALLAAGWFAVFAVPLFLMVPDRSRRRRPVGTVIRRGLLDLMVKLRRAGRYRNVARFLLAKMIYIDGLNTLFTFGGIYAAEKFGFDFEQLLIYGCLINVTAGLGAALFAWSDDWIGAKPTILAALVALTLLGVAILLVEDIWWFYFLSLAIGVFFGPVQAASRSFMARLAPPRRRTEFFGLYNFSGRATAFLGPLLVAWATRGFEDLTIGMATIVPFFVVGIVLLLRVEEPGRTAGGH